MNLYRILGIALVVTVGTGVTLSVLTSRPGLKGGLHPAAQMVAVPAMVRSLRPTYPYSIIPGGVYSRAELQVQLRRDPLARRHYADFNAENTRLISSEHEQFAYASYRQRGQVFWTKNKLRIPKGELLLTDGHHLARTRCGNRLSSKKPAVADTSADEPVADLTMPTASDSNITDQRITFSQPPPSQTVLAASTSPPLEWQPRDLPFQWVPFTRNLSAIPTTSGSLANMVGGPFLFPSARTATATGTTRPAKTTTPGSTSPGQPTIIVPVVPLTPVPEPSYTAFVAAALALVGGKFWWRSRQRAGTMLRSSK